ncbi:hypothetical protein M430DRAFT_32879 [Amorphotheca resinae ATCC 22711]|uniref:Uncharacterized protein n=1 Tax=Amorphotheca resinae ATCC 22711 TaxID=857342 RepID=A0A2T3B9R2_AMORE|nr:hypothetical protein M430DRAFT_32879 [Amorphotheca resinae ATCC 22711]PSS25014.1 hypothetical protein M430DRAFT_32879 [Amorphotheca resinae ATCC 22711]
MRNSAYAGALWVSTPTGSVDGMAQCVLNRERAGNLWLISYHPPDVQTRRPGKGSECSEGEKGEVSTPEEG